MFNFFMWLRFLSFCILLEKISLFCFKIIRLGEIGEIRLLFLMIFMRKSLGKFFKWFCLMVLLISLDLVLIFVLIMYLW